MSTSTTVSDDDDDAEIRTAPFEESGAIPSSTLTLHCGATNNEGRMTAILYHTLHRSYIVQLSTQFDDPNSLEGAMAAHLKMSGVYWSYAALALLEPYDYNHSSQSSRDDNNNNSSNRNTISSSSTNNEKQQRNEDDATNNNRHSSNIDLQRSMISIARLLVVNNHHYDSIVDWVLDCWDSRSGGFGGGIGDDGHLLYTLSALQILAMAGWLLQEPPPQAAPCASYESNDIQNQQQSHQQEQGQHQQQQQHRRYEHWVSTIRPAVIAFVVALQQPNGSFVGDVWGEVDTRFTYCALQSLSLLHALHRIDTRQAAHYVMMCRNATDGGFGCTPGAESHAGQVFCCVASLSIAQSLDLLLNLDPAAALLGWWLAERQVDSGGLNGRPEKQSDVCYSWWILSSLSILGKSNWIDGDRLALFILACQDDIDGGIADRPDNMADVFHTFFGLAGLSLLGTIHHQEQSQPRSNTTITAISKEDSPTTERSPPTLLQRQRWQRRFGKIDPIYALPSHLVQDMQLPGQVYVHDHDHIDERLVHYRRFEEASNGS